MKKSITDRIEQYIKVLISRSEEQRIEIQRAELAETFSCVPSQVTYVLSTRFGYKDGFITESRRGGKGYVRITRVRPTCNNRSRLWADMIELLNRFQEDQGLDESESRTIDYLLSTLLFDLTRDQRHQVLPELIGILERIKGNRGIEDDLR